MGWIRSWPNCRVGNIIRSESRGSPQGSALTLRGERSTHGNVEIPDYVKELIAGGFASGFAKSAVAPLERLKILHQVTTSYTTGLDNSLRCVGVQPAYKGITDVFTKVYWGAGLRGLYQGVGMECRRSFSARSFSSDTSALPPIIDPDVKQALKNLLASSWDELRDSIKSDVMYALSKETDDTVGREALANAWHAAEAVEEFSGVLLSLRMELDELSGSSGENVRPLSDELQGALRAAYKRYNTYLDAFGPDEAYLRKKVEIELGTKMIHIKMRCSGLDSEWGKITALGTSGLSGSYIEHRAA